MKRFDLTGKVAIVTGGNGGIGAGIARGLLECGAAVVIAARKATKNAAMVADLSVLGPPVSAFEMDVPDEAQCQEVVRETVRRHGRLDILVNNAGSGMRPDEMTLEQWNAVMTANLTSAFMLSQAAYPEMKKIGCGKIINIGSIAAYLASPGTTALGSSKAGIIQLARSRQCMGEGQHPGERDPPWRDRNRNHTGDAGECSVPRNVCWRAHRPVGSEGPMTWRESPPSWQVRRPISSQVLPFQWMAESYGAFDELVIRRLKKLGLWKVRRYSRWSTLIDII
jgi:NADP-dependent 3-hydroxy acid dehydrogenase YdfG